ncbi:hypothetical protein [Helicobacter pylori]|uniref:hypothetical protein n=1 Tax=Helicobacter pylori TaxID=210 RepID=UPI000674B048|nr:hypothetical protein [Helicobacter pylori]
MGCGSGGESPVEIEKNDFNSTLKIISKADNIEIQDLKLNRGNCKPDENFLVKLIQERTNAYQSVAEKEKAIKNHQAKIARLQKDLEELTQWVQQFNSLDKFWENIINAFGGSYFFQEIITSIVKLNLNIDNLKHDFDSSHNPIFRIKKLLSFGDKPLYSPNVYDVYEVDNAFYSIRSAIEDTKNPKDYPYINLKELKKLIDSIVDDKGNLVHGFFTEFEKKDYWDYHNICVKKGLQRLAKLKSMWPSVGKFYFAYLKEAIPRHAKEVTDKLISSEEKPIQAIQAKLAEISKMEKIIKDLESKKNTMAVDLKFGESFTTQYRCQNLIEVGVKTDKGTWTFNFNR